MCDGTWHSIYISVLELQLGKSTIACDEKSKNASTLLALKIMVCQLALLVKFTIVVSKINLGPFGNPTLNATCQDEPSVEDQASTSGFAIPVLWAVLQWIDTWDKDLISCRLETLYI